MTSQIDTSREPSIVAKLAAVDVRRSVRVGVPHVRHKPRRGFGCFIAVFALMDKSLAGRPAVTIFFADFYVVVQFFLGFAHVAAASARELMVDGGFCVGGCGFDVVVDFTIGPDCVVVFHLRFARILLGLFCVRARNRRSRGA